uniref:Uncharacterized protein n=1 Tax=Plectus sambesii TaxID=2011161 RepID=A0A914XMF0_9BILA
MAADLNVGEEIDAIKRLPGLSMNPGHFCAHQNGRIAFFFNYSKVAFFKIDLAFGVATEVKTEWPYKIRAPQDWCSISSVERSSRTFILALILEDSTNKFFIASFAVSKHKIAVADEHYLGVDYAIDSTVVNCIMQDEYGQIYCIIYYYNFQENRTIFHLLSMNIDENGSVTSKIITNNKAIPKSWFQPFIYADTLLWLPKDDASFAQLCEISLLDERFITLVDTFRDEADDVAAFDCFRISRSVLIEEKAFYYACHDKLKISRLLYFDPKKQTWQQLKIDMKDHIIIGGRVPMQEKYHIYLIDVNALLQAELQTKKPSSTINYKISIGEMSDTLSSFGVQELTTEVRQAIIDQFEAGLNKKEEYEVTAM